MWIPVLVLAVIFGSGFVLFLGIRAFFNPFIGWDQLAASYRAPHLPPQWDWRHQTVKVGAVRYRRTMRVAVRPEGLYLDEAGILRHPVLCIPWRDLCNPTETKFYGRQAVRLQAGPGTVELPVELYNAVLRLRRA